MSDWITDRRPMHEDDGAIVYGPDGNICHWTWIKNGDAWKPIPKCEPYVKPKRWLAVWSNVRRMWTLRNTSYSDPDVHAYNIGLVCLDYLSKQDEHREAAERIAAIYEEVMP